VWAAVGEKQALQNAAETLRESCVEDEDEPLTPTDGRPAKK
jgi:hypothetical protein